jgi:hypothetical protein
VVTIRQVLGAPRYGALWAQAQQLAAHGRYAEAKRLLEAAFAAVSLSFPSDKATVEGNMTAAVIALGLADQDLGVASVKAIQAILKSRKTKLDPASRLFIQIFQERVLKSLPIPLSIADFSIKRVDTSNLNIKSVRRSLRKNFSL